MIERIDSVSPDPSPDATPERCATQLMDAIPLVMRVIRTEMRSQSASLLSVPQFRTLAFLDRHPGSSLSDLAEHLGVTRATASAMTERLVQRDFIDRAGHPTERRQVVLKLTADGTSYLQQIRATTRTKIAGLLTSLSETQLSKLLDGLTSLSQVFGEQ
jgi:DNA-binding MarR family transcriptional regulator